MARYKLIIEYDGSQFFGFQRQRDCQTVQGCLEDAIYQMTQETVVVYGSGRTDAGVQALGQVVHFDLKMPRDCFKLGEGLNYYVSSFGISIVAVDHVAQDFHARFSAIERSYIYKILNRRAPSPLYHLRAWHIKKELDMGAMHMAAQNFIGQHDFSTFRCSGCQSPSPVRTIDHCHVTKQDDFIFFHVAARSFLHNQIRIMVGSLVQVGLAKQKPDWIQGLLQKPDRTLAGPTAPPHGLYFARVEY